MAEVKPAPPLPFIFLLLTIWQSWVCSRRVPCLAIIITNQHLVNFPHYKEPRGGSGYRKVGVSVLEILINLGEEGRNMHQKINHNLRYQMDRQKNNLGIMEN